MGTNVCRPCLDDANGERVVKVRRKPVDEMLRPQRIKVAAGQVDPSNFDYWICHTCTEPVRAVLRHKRGLTRPNRGMNREMRFSRQGGTRKARKATDEHRYFFGGNPGRPTPERRKPRLGRPGFTPRQYQRASACPPVL